LGREKKDWDGILDEFYLKEFLYYTTKTLRTKYPKIVLGNSLGMKKTILTLEDFTTDLRIP
jgi:hypothetical protein